MLGLKICGWILTNSLIGLIITGISLAFKTTEFSKFYHFISDKMEDVFKIENKHGIEQFFPIVLFLNISLPSLVLYLVFYFMRLIYLFLLKFPFVLCKQSYYLLTKKKG
jgi:hypothetical protein